MVGAIANDGGEKISVTNDGSPKPHEYVSLAKHQSTPLLITHSGYLYCFPNDAWSKYENNYGSVELTITRVT